MVMNNSIFWDITLYSLLKINFDLQQTTQHYMPESRTPKTWFLYMVFLHHKNCATDIQHCNVQCAVVVSNQISLQNLTPLEHLPLIILRLVFAWENFISLTKPTASSSDLDKSDTFISSKGIHMR
jgi:hypothetical protein